MLSEKPHVRSPGTVLHCSTTNLFQCAANYQATSGKPEKYLTGLADLFPAYSENKPIKETGDHGFKPY